MSPAVEAVRRLGPAAVAVALVAPAGAEAQQPAPRDVAAVHFEPTPAGDRFFAVPDGQVRGFMDGYAKVVGAYGHRPLRHTDDGREYVTSQLFGYADLTLSLAHLLMLNVDLPVAIWQQGDDGFSDEPGTALGDLRTTLRIGAYRSPQQEVGVGAQLDVWFPTGNADLLAGDGAMRASPKLGLSGTVDWFHYALSAGYLFRERARLGTAEVGGAITYGAGVAALLWQDTLQIGPEIQGQAVVPDSDHDASFFDEGLTPVEALFGAKLRLGFVVLGAAAGPGLTNAPGVAAYRFVGSVAFVEDHRIFDRDGDRLNDELDRCPDEPGFDDYGCPLPDRDGDTVIDREDACPDLPGLVHAVASKHGCPAR
jgi:hypothetical protein